jgi:prevent-host-death family protein
MHTVSVAEAKANLSKVLNRVQAGEDVVITRRGKPVARIAAMKDALEPIPSLEKFRATLPKAKTPSVKIIRQMRDETY